MNSVTINNPGVDKIYKSFWGYYFNTLHFKNSADNYTFIFEDNAAGNVGKLKYLGLSFSKYECGDGFNENLEECDDANLENNDWCSSDCKLECGWKCPLEGLACVRETCGNGLIGLYEDCDDGNNINDDGCSYNCLLETN